MMTLQKLARLVTGNHGLIKTWHQKTKQKNGGTQTKTNHKKGTQAVLYYIKFPLH
jgi:hypothetical protein